jgi:2-oxoglutarate dehydrogenase E2 component (dihydrolipoamide succinyltransferase)
MADIRVPHMGLTVEEATLVEWLKEVGDHISPGDAVAELETDKITTEVLSEVSGVIVEHCASPDDIVVPGQVIARLG